MASSSRTFPGNRWLRLLRSLSCCLGVSPTRKQLRQLHLIWSLLLLIWIWIVCVTLLMDKSKKHVLAIEKLLYLIEYPSNMIITALFSLSVYRNGEFFRRQRTQQLRLMKLIYAEAQLCLGILGGIARKLLLMIFSFHAVCIVIDVYWLRFELLQTLLSNSAHNLVGLMVSLSLLQYVLDLRVLHLLHLRLNEHLGEIQQQKLVHSICILSPATFDQIEPKLEHFRWILITMDDMHMKLTQRFGLVFMVNYVNSLLTFCYELFNVFRILESNWTDDLLTFFYRLLWLLMHVLRIWCTLISNARIAEQKCQLCLILNKLNAQNPRLESSINRFLLQIQANGINGCPYTVCGVIDLDTLAVGGFVSALTTIVIFLIQIDLGNKSLMGYSF